MKIRSVISFLLMLGISILVTVNIVLLTVVININQNSIYTALKETKYTYNTYEKTDSVLNTYIPKEDVDKVKEKLDNDEYVKTIVRSLGTNDIPNEETKIKEEISSVVLESIEKNTSKDVRNSFANTVTDKYIKALFPVNEYITFSNMYAKYYINLKYLTVVLAITSLVMIASLVLIKKGYKWLTISIYNVVIFLTIIYFGINILDGINILNSNITKVIAYIINGIKQDILIAVVLNIVLAIILNIVFYERRKKKRL